MLQMTRMTVSGSMDFEYRYSATANNGQITSMKNHISGEDVSYTYDSLKRLTAAVTVGPEWGQGYDYDGFGNLTAKTVIKGSAGAMSIAVSGTTNRVVGWSYDANGNVTAIPGTFPTVNYDVDNRMTYLAQGWGGFENYGYRPDNKRLWRLKATGAVEFYFYEPSGERQGRYKWDVDSSGNIAWYLVGLDSVIPKGLQVNRDRLGSVMTSGGSTRWYPYGEESPATAHDQDKFATYHRDTTGLNYADQRYYATTTSRFLTADPYKASAGPSDPGSWNRYAYVQGDPVNLNDSRGLWVQHVGSGWCSVGSGEGRETVGCDYFVIDFSLPVPQRIPNPEGESILLDLGLQGSATVEGIRFRNVSVGGSNQMLINRTLAGIQSIWDGGHDNRCRDWFGEAAGRSGLSVDTFLSTVPGMMGHGDIVGQRNIGGVTGPGLAAAFGVPVIFNSSGAFFQNIGATQSGDVYREQVSGIQPNSDSRRVMIMLHEWAHLLSARGFLRDGPNSNLPEQAQAFNADLLWDQCNRTIQAFSNRPR